MDSIILTPALTAQLQRYHLPIETRYRFERLEAKHFNSTVEMFTRSFCTSEPMTQYVNMQFEEFRPFARAVVGKCIDDGLSIVAVDKGLIIACSLVEDLINPLQLESIDPKFEPIFTLLEQLGVSIAQYQFEPNQVAHLFITAVHNRYRRQHLSTQVNFRAMEMARQVGFSQMYCEFTNYFNECGTMSYIHQKQLVGSIRYAQFQLAHSFPFARLGGGAQSFLWSIR